MKMTNHSEHVSLQMISMTAECVRTMQLRMSKKTEKPKLEHILWYIAVWHFLLGNGEKQGEKPV